MNDLNWLDDMLWLSFGKADIILIFVLLVFLAKFEFKDRCSD